MSVAAALLDKLNRAGATLEIVDGKPRVRGAKIAAELMEELKAHRDDVLAEYEKRRAEDRDRYGKVPREEVPMISRDALMPGDVQRIVLRYVASQERPTHAWVVKRAAEYHNIGAAMEDCDWKACADLIAWQRQTDVRGLVDFVTGNEECAQPPKPKPEPKKKK